MVDWSKYDDYDTSPESTRHKCDRCGASIPKGKEVYGMSADSNDACVYCSQACAKQR